jgi:hypothetical protein
MVGAKLANMQQGGDSKSDEIKSAIAPLITQKQAADMLNVGVDSIKRSWRTCRKAITSIAQLRYPTHPSPKSKPPSLLTLCLN